MGVMLVVVWLLPLVGAVALWALGPELKRAAGVLGSAAVLLAFAFAVALFAGASQAGGVHVPLGAWIAGYTSRPASPCRSCPRGSGR